MHSVDANLLLALDALLREGSVLGAARRMHLSPPAMSRTLARIREAMGDPVLVRAGRRLVPTPRALAIRERVRLAAAETRSLLSPDAPLNLATLERTFTIRTNDYLVAAFGPVLDALVRAEAPRVRLVMSPEGAEDVEPLRAGELDLDIGVQSELGPELRTRRLYEDPMVAIVRKGHPLARGRLTSKRLASVEHVGVSRRGKLTGRIDRVLAEEGLKRTVTRVVPTHLAGAWLVAESDLLGVVPQRLAERVARTLPLQVLALPFPLEPLSIRFAWHPRHDGDAAHAWLRDCIIRAARGGERG
jgi:DNA-binding transcriptional LysR family regulator